MVQESSERVYRQTHYTTVKDKKKTNRRKVERVIRKIWSSLESHLKYTYNKSTEGTKFHIQCVRDYAAMIKDLSDVL